MHFPHSKRGVISLPRRDNLHPTSKVLRPLEVWGKAQPPGRSPPGKDRKEESQGSEEKGRQRSEEEGDGEAGKGKGSTNLVCGQHTRYRYLAGRWSHCLKGDKIIPGVYGCILSPPTTFSNVGLHMHVYMPEMCMFANACAGINVYMLMHISMKMYTCI